MRAIVMRGFGGPEVLASEEVATPEPAADEALIEVRGVSINRVLDIAVRQGSYPRKPVLPHVLGVDPVGIVAKLGRDVSGIRAGDRVAIDYVTRCGQCAPCRRGDLADCENFNVIGLTRWGGYAEYVAVPARNLYRLPEKVGFPEGVAIARHLPTAIHLLEDKAALTSGEWVLVMGAAGGLGAMGVQAAKLMGATVIAAAGAPERVRVALDLGADHGIDYRATDLALEIKRLTGGRGVDVVFENMGEPALWKGAFASLAKNGRLVTAGGHAGGIVEIDVNRLYLNRLRIIGGVGHMPAHVQRAMDLAATGRIRAKIDRVMPLREAAAAHALLARRGELGKVILDPTMR